MIRVWQTVLFLLICMPLSFANATEQTGEITRPPAVVESAQPEYPAEAQAAGITGDVILEIEISATGEVASAKVISPLGHGLDEAALTAAKHLRFSPAEIDGKPAAVRIEYRFHFEMKPAVEPNSPAQQPGEPGASVESATVNLRGKIVERGSREPLAGAMVDINDGAISVYTDIAGNFEAAGVPIGDAKIVVLQTAHARFETSEKVEEGKVTVVTYYLKRLVQGAFETVVIGEKDKKEVSAVAISVGEITRIPGVSGDTVRVIQNLPGTARTPMGSGALVLRGGNPFDSKVYVDGIQVPMVFHFGGLTSIYSSELTEQVIYEPGNFGVRYGRATAGRVEIKSRDPNAKMLRIAADANVFHATAMAEGPISDKVSIAVAGRRSYIDSVLNQVKNNGANLFAIAPRYYDYQGRITWTPTKNDTVRFSFFGSDDRVTVVGIKENTTGLFDSFDTRFQFSRATLSWDRRLGPATKFSILGNAGYTAVLQNMGSFFKADEKEFSAALRSEIDHELNKKLSLAAGFDGQFFRDTINLRTPPIGQANGLENSIDVRQSSVRMDELFRVYMPAIWAQAVYKPIERLSIIPGVRFDYVSFIRSFWFDPRLAARWAVTDSTTLKGAIGIYHQYPFPANVTKEYGNPDLGAEGSRQYSLGVERKIFKTITADVQVYYKDLYDLAVPSSRTITRDGESVPERFSNSGTGRAYGAELLLRYHSDGRFYGWLAYSYSRTKRNNTDIGGRIPMEQTGDEFDQPHNLTMVGTLELPEIWNGLSAGFRLRFSSGNPYSTVTNAIFDVDGGYYSPIYASTKNARLPNFFQLDLRVDKKWTFDQCSFSTYVELQNATNRTISSDYAPVYSFDYSKSEYMSWLPIIPSVGLRFEY